MARVHPCRFNEEEARMLYRCFLCASETTEPLLEVNMATKPTPVKPTVHEAKAVVCQCCRFHSNHPSTCSFFAKFVGRKMDATKCEGFKRKA